MGDIAKDKKVGNFTKKHRMPKAKRRALRKAQRRARKITRMAA